MVGEILTNGPDLDPGVEKPFDAGEFDDREKILRLAEIHESLKKLYTDKRLMDQELHDLNLRHKPAPDNPRMTLLKKSLSVVQRQIEDLMEENKNLRLELNLGPLEKPWENFDN